MVIITVREEQANLFLSLLRDILEDISIRLVRVATFLAGCGIILETFAHELGAKVEGIAEGLMDTLKRVTASHEHLDSSGLLYA